MNLKSEFRPLVLLALVGFVVFANTLGGDFVYDDTRQILRNPLIQDPELYGKALTSDVWAFKGDGTIAASNYYRPTFVAWLILNFKIFGTNAFGWHLGSVLLHILVSLLGYLLLRRWNVPAKLSFAMALIFAVNPVHTESVAWISGSPDLLFSAFLLGALWFAQRDAGKSRKISPDLIIALIFYACALGAKEVGILCFPLFYLIFANQTSKQNEETRRVRSPFLRVVPFAALAALYFAARWFALGAVSLPPEGGGNSFTQAILTAPAMFVFYLRQIIFPFWLGANYPLRPLSAFDPVEFLLPLVIALAAVALLALLARKSFVQKFGFALFFLTLAPAMNLMVFPAEQIVHDRYLYLPLFGFLLMIFPDAATVFEKFFKEKSEFVLILCAVLLSLPLALKTFTYNQVWKTEFALWSHAVKIDPSSAFNWSQYAAVLSESGKIPEAVEAYNTSIDIRPTALAYYGKARNLLAQNKTDEAIFDLKTILEMPNEKINAYTLYQAYELMALALAQQKKYGDAQKYLFEGRRRLPIYYAALTEKLAVVSYQAGEKTTALRELEAARAQAKTELLPESKSVFLRLGMLYAEFGRKDEARAALQEYLNLTANLGDRISVTDRRQALGLLKSLQ